MSRRHYYKHKSKEEDIDVTPLLNVMVVLVAFLIFSAVFTRISIQELVLPTQGDAKSAQDTPQLVVEVIVRKNALEIGDGKAVIASIPKLGNRYDTQKLSEYLLRIKDKYKDKQDANILLEPDIEYEAMIQVMDAVKIAEIKKEGQDRTQRISLFPQVSIGDAP